MLMGQDDDVEKKAIYLGRTLEWSENGLGVRPDASIVTCALSCEGWEWRTILPG